MHHALVAADKEVVVGPHCLLVVCQCTRILDFKRVWRSKESKLLESLDSLDQNVKGRRKSRWSTHSCLNFFGFLIPYK
jgi:hypothetical protein